MKSLRLWRSPEDTEKHGDGDGGHGEVEMHEYQALSDGPSPHEFLEEGEGSVTRLAIQDLDTFFRQIYYYHTEKGLVHITLRWAAELFTFGFTICFSGFLLLVVNWYGVLHCGQGEGSNRCELSREGVHQDPLRPFTFYKAVVLLYLFIFTLYWVVCFFRFFSQLRDNLVIRRFFHSDLGLGEEELQEASWAEVVERLVEVQSRKRLCIVRDLSTPDIVSRIMRKENWLIAMLNQGVIALPLWPRLPGAGPFQGHHDAHGNRKYPVLTKTLEWSLNWCILHHMYDSNFLIKPDFTRRPDVIRRRFRALGGAMLLLSPFYLIFMLMYFLMKNGEQFYHRPSTAGFRDWSNLARWTFREFNELDHCLKHRMDASYKHAVEYLKLFPSSPTLLVVAKVVSYVAGAFAVVLLGTVVVHETVLQAALFGHEVGWYVAVFGTLSVLSRSLIAQDFLESTPESAMQSVVQHTHYQPDHWVGQESSERVRSEFQRLFQYRAVEFLEEIASIFTTPILLCFKLPYCVDDILSFVRDSTTLIPGVGHVCSLSVFDGISPAMDNDEKMSKSLASFRHNYPGWMPEDAKPLQEEEAPDSPAPHPDPHHSEPEEPAPFYTSPQDTALNSNAAKEAMDRSRWWARTGPEQSVASLFAESKFEPPSFGVAEFDDGQSRLYNSQIGHVEAVKTKAEDFNESLLYKHS